MSLLSRALSASGKSPRTDLHKFATWIPWVNRSGTPMHKAYFYGTAVPEITRALLKRRYPDNADPALVNLSKTS